MKTKLIKKRHLILPGIALFIILVLFAAPRLAKWYLVRNGHELIGRSISIEKIRINYFTGTLRINGFSLFEEDGKTVFLGFGQLLVNLDYLPLIRNEFLVQSVFLENPFIQVMQDGTRFNFSDLIDTDTTVVTSYTIPSEPTKYIINNISIAGGYVKYTDIPLNHTISLERLDLKIPGFTWNSDSTKFNIDFRFVDGGGLYSDLEVNQADSTYLIKLRLDSLNLAIAEPYLKNYLNISSLRGYMTNNLLIKGSISSVLKLFISGVNDIYAFQLQDTLKRTVLSFNDLKVDIDTFQLDLNRLILKSITLKDPFILFELIDSTNNLLALIKSTTNVKADSINLEADSTIKEIPFHYNLPPVSISGGRILVSDKTLNYPFDYTIDNLKFESSEPDKESGKISLKLTTGLNGTGSLNMKGVINPENPEKDLDLDLAIGQFRIKDMDPYFRHYLGFPVKGGIMNFNTGNKLRDKTLDSQNRIFFRRFILEPRMETETEYRIPLRLAIGILSDKDGIIDLKAPVKMKGDEVKIINLGRIVFRVIGNLFVKAAVSPLNLLSGIYETDPASLQEIPLGLTEISPDTKGMKSVDIISDILDKKPQLNVDLIYCIDRMKAADSLAYLLCQENYARNSMEPEKMKGNIPDSILIKYLLGRSAYNNVSDTTDLKLLCRTFIGPEKLNSGLDSIRTLQTQFITNYLQRDRAVPENRFRIIEITPDSIIPSVNHPSFRIYFTAGGE